MPTTVTRPGILLATAVVTGAAVPALYWLAVRTRWGQEADAASLDALSRERNPVAYDAAEDLLATISISSLAFFGLGLIALALLRGRLAVAVAAALAILGANVTSQLLKDSLPRPLLIADDIPTNSYPSGHATVAMSLALGLVLVTPSALRPVAAALGGVYAAAVGGAVILLSWHRPSDVIGAFLVAACWTALAGAVAALGEHGPRRRLSARAETVSVGAALVLAAGFVAVGAAAVLSRVDVLSFAEDRTAVTAAVLAAGVGAAVCVTAMTVLLERSRVGDPPSPA